MAGTAVLAWALLRSSELPETPPAFFLAGFFAASSGSPERAAILYGAGDRHFVMEKAPFCVRQLQPGVDSFTAALGAERFRRLHDCGAAMTIEAATDFLRAVSRWSRSRVASRGPRRADGTSRQWPRRGRRPVPADRG